MLLLGSTSWCVCSSFYCFFVSIESNALGSLCVVAKGRRCGNSCLFGLRLYFVFVRLINVLPFEIGNSRAIFRGEDWLRASTIGQSSYLLTSTQLDEKNPRACTRDMYQKIDYCLRVAIHSKCVRERHEVVLGAHVPVGWLWRIYTFRHFL
jgi:hypothetical protein